MDTDLHSLAYVSRSALTPAILGPALDDILRAARRTNPGRGLTGALLVSGGWFAQVIEGPRDSVQAIFERISRDPRHSDIAVLHFQPIPARRFGAWAMAHADPVPPAIDIGGILASPGAIETGEAGRDLLQILTGIIELGEEDLRANPDA